MLTPNAEDDDAGGAEDEDQDTDENEDADKCDREDVTGSLRDDRWAEVRRAKGFAASNREPAAKLKGLKNQVSQRRKQLTSRQRSEVANDPVLRQLSAQIAATQARFNADFVRSTAPESLLDALDAVACPLGDTAAQNPLLGRGGADGRLNFSRKYNEYLSAALGAVGSDPATHA